MSLSNRSNQLISPSALITDGGSPSSIVAKNKQDVGKSLTAPSRSKNSEGPRNAIDYMNTNKHDNDIIMIINNHDY